MSRLKRFLGLRRYYVVSGQYTITKGIGDDEQGYFYVSIGIPNGGYPTVDMVSENLPNIDTDYEHNIIIFNINEMSSGDWNDFNQNNEKTN